MHDFQVARKGGGSAFTGGVYTSAVAGLRIITPFTVDIRRVPAGTEINFPPAPGVVWMVQYRDDLDGGAGWANLPDGPHSSGVVTDSVPSVIQRFYRVEGFLP